MAHNYHRQSAAPPSDYISSSTSESEEPELVSKELTQREYNDHRLIQAIDYLDSEGGDDSPELFMDRVNRIDKDLLLKLRRPGRDYDPILYRDVRAFVNQYQREFNEEQHKIANQMEASDDSLPEDSTPKALHRTAEIDPDFLESSPPKPTSTPSSSIQSRSAGKVEFERRFKYGGPKNEVEHWHKKFPASLPFPETLHLAHWESLQIDADLARGAKGESGGPEIVVPFNHPQLEQYKHLDQYDSGSRFKLAVPNAGIEQILSKVRAVDKLKEVVEAINKGELGKTDKQKYAPRLFLEKFAVGRQLSPTAIRRALNASPSTARQRSQSNSSGIVSPLDDTVRRLFNDTTTELSPWAEDFPPKATSPAPAPAPKPQTHRANPVARRISAHRAVALHNAARQESLPTPKQPRTPTRRTMTHVAISAPAKRGPGRPRKTAAPEPLVIPTPPSKKRKRSEGSQYYTPDGKRRSAGQEEYVPLTTTLRSMSVARERKKIERKKTGAKGRKKSVHWSSESEEGRNFGLKKLPVPVVVRKGKGDGEGKAKMAAKKAATEKTVAVELQKLEPVDKLVEEKMQTRSGRTLG